jgi:hypothetical protein
MCDLTKIQVWFYETQYDWASYFSVAFINGAEYVIFFRNLLKDVPLATRCDMWYLHTEIHRIVQT